MTVTCPECRSVFRVDPAKVPASGVRARCAVCGGVIAIAGGTLPVTVGAESAPASFPPLAPSSRPVAVPTPAVAPAAAPSATPAPSAPRVPPTPAVPSAPVPAVAPASVAPASVPTMAPPAAPVVAPPMVPLVAPVAPRRPTPAYTDIPVSFPALGRMSPTPAGGVPVPGTLAAVASGAVTLPEAGAASGGVSAAASLSAPPTAPVAAPFSAPGPDAMAAPVVPAAARAPAPMVGMPTPGQDRPSINPFLRADPDTRARRLARALVSDLVAYHPQKREEGLRDGSLRQLFRDDIRKSYEEYVEQVGRELAEQTRYFQDALNDILAGGRALF